MSASKTKQFVIADVPDLEKVDKWWANLLRKGPKEINLIEWVPNGDLVWILKITWSKLDNFSQPFNVCMPAYSSYSVDELSEILSSFKEDRNTIKSNIKLFKLKIDEWEVSEVSSAQNLDSSSDELLPDFIIDPNLSYATKLDTVEKIMVSEFLWPWYKTMCRSLLMYEAKIEELRKELDHRSSSSYTVVRVDRGMLRSSFLNQIGYDNKWLFATDEELFDDYITDDEDFNELDD